MVTVHELRKSGNVVKVKHIREFGGIHKLGETDNFMTRGEYEQARLDGELQFDNDDAMEFYEKVYGVVPGKLPSYGKAVFPDGGWTEVIVTTPEGKELKGKYSFQNKPFNKRIGLAVSLGRAITGNLRKDKRKEKLV